MSLIPPDRESNTEALGDTVKAKDESFGVDDIIGQEIRDALTIQPNIESSDANEAKDNETKDVSVRNELDVASSLGTFNLSGVTASEANALTFSCWDFGGQRVFQTLQHLFLSRYGVYVIAFDLVKLCRYTATQPVIDNSLSYMQFWLRLIEMSALGAPVVLLGTHLDCLDEALALKGEGMNRIEALKEIDNLLISRFSHTQKAWRFVEMTRNKAEELVFYPVINEGSDYNIIKLRYFIEQLAVDDRVSEEDTCSYVDSKIPVTWLRACDALRDLEKKGVCYVSKMPSSTQQSKEEVEVSVYDIAEACDMFAEAPSEMDRKTILSAFLHHFNKLGLFLHIDEPGLDDVIILDPQWIMDLIVAVIRDFSLHHLLRDRKLIASKQKQWYNFINKGVLSRDILDVLWFEQIEKKDHLTSFLIKMHLMCPLPPLPEEGEEEEEEVMKRMEEDVSYLVPSVFMVSDSQLALMETALDPSRDFLATIEVQPINYEVHNPSQKIYK